MHHSCVEESSNIKNDSLLTKIDNQKLRLESRVFKSVLYTDYADTICGLIQMKVLLVVRNPTFSDNDNNYSRGGRGGVHLDRAEYLCRMSTSRENPRRHGIMAGDRGY